ncbi:hypothetical protein [Denitromonas iodatirespirans]|uniref:DUF4148 domain-containing protein n=1 Tax=Denitromonas iodatirespirans TaxID=2795389 RepID=A0A944DBI9_DENI1|nr:hypothetical protein [Denitromonas iodatirespirans]MBT0962026.1 hypothetical protein [Denitromonas iodatirespirans]
MGAWRAGLAAALLCVAAAGQAADPLPSPAGAAHLKAERARIERAFVDEVSAVAGVSGSQVRRGMPNGPRITDTGRRVIESLEHQTGRTLSDDQRAAIQAADARREAALARARAEAARR